MQPQHGDIRRERERDFLCNAKIELEKKKEQTIDNLKRDNKFGEDQKLQLQRQIGTLQTQIDTLNEHARIVQVKSK